MKSFKRILCAAVLLPAFCLALALTGAAAMPGDIDGDNQITPADARIVLRISVGLEKLEDYFPDWQNATDPSTPGTDEPDPQEIPEDLAFLLAVKITDDGYFVAGESTAMISVTPNANLASAKFAIVDAAEETVFAQTLKNLKKDQPATVEWDGKSGDTYALSGDYTVVVRAGEKETKLEGLSFTQKNYFSEGNGSESHPFLVASKEDFANVVRFPKAHFKQTRDIDYNLEANTSMFTKDAPFNGVYDGDGKAFMNILTTNPLFNYVGEEGKIKNIKVKDSNFSCKSALIGNNSGQVSGCEIDAKLNCNVSPADHYYAGLLCEHNGGLVTNCKTAGLVSAYNGSNCYYISAGGIIGHNIGKILNCSSTADVKSSAASTDYSGAGGIVGINWEKGFIKNCEASGTVKATHTGGIAYRNEGQVSTCIYTGSSEAPLVNTGKGIVS